MSNVRYYVDEHIGGAIVNGLRQRGVDVMTVTEAGLRGKADEIQLAFALKAGRTIFTQDRDFLRRAACAMRASCMRLKEHQSIKSWRVFV